MTRNQYWIPAAKRYFAWKDDLRMLALAEGYELEEPLSLTFVLPVPKSCTKKERERRLGNPHRTTPDLDNMIKAFKDALSDNDAGIAEYGTMRKIWGESGAIIIHS